MTVVGVMEDDGEIIMIPAGEGMVESLSVEFNCRMGAEGKIKRLIEEY